MASVSACTASEERGRSGTAGSGCGEVEAVGVTGVTGVAALEGEGLGLTGEEEFASVKGSTVESLAGSVRVVAAGEVVVLLVLLVLSGFGGGGGLAGRGLALTLTMESIQVARIILAGDRTVFTRGFLSVMLILPILRSQDLSTRNYLKIRAFFRDRTTGKL